MTDKQIMIDGVDVSRCEFFEYKKMEDWQGNIRIYKFCNEITELEDCSPAYECSDKERTNCYYKQLKRAEKTMQEIWDRLGKVSDEFQAKEQECEKIKEDNATLFDKAIEARKECTDLKEQLFLLKIDYAELLKQLDQLKAD